MSPGERLGEAGVPDEDVELLERQLAELAAGGEEASEVLAKLAEAVFPGRVAMGDPTRLLWPEPGRGPTTGGAGADGLGRGVGGGVGGGPGGLGGGPGHGPIQPQQQLEAQIRQSEARFRSLVEQLPALVFYAALGDEENEVYVSPQIEDLLGFTQEEWLTNPLLWYSQLHPDDHETVIEAFTRGMQTGEPFRATVRFFSRSGEVVWFLGEARLIRDESLRPAYFQGVAFDVTITKRAEEAIAQAERAKVDAAHLRADAFATHNIRLRQLNKELRAAKEAAEAAAQVRTTFLTTMSHELRTPLNSVIVLAGLLADEDLSPTQQDMLRRMRLASDNLLELINDVLEFSRLRAGQVELDRRTFELEAWVHDTLEIVAPRAAEKGLDLRLVVAAGVPRTLTADQGRLRQVLLNLLANAVKFTTSGFVEVRIGAEPLGEGRWEFSCAVADSGIGIRPEDAVQLFDEFRQADSGIAREFGGTGLGLAICKRLCDLLGGRIWIDDSGGNGATVAFTWVAEVDGDGRRPPGTATAEGADSGRVSGRQVSEEAAPVKPRSVPPKPQPLPLRILVAEDNLMNQQVALLLLSAMGYRADVVGNGDEAIAAVRGDTYDVVLMDIAMPGTDGLSATRAIRELGAEVHQPYIVALTAHAFPGDADNCIAAGMDDYVAKPVDREQLARALRAGARAAGTFEPPPGGDAVVAGGADPGAVVAGDPAAAGAAGAIVAGGADPAAAGAIVTGGADPAAAGAAGPGPAPVVGELADPDFDPALPLEMLGEFGREPLGRLIAIFRTEATRLIAAAVVAVASDDLDQAERAAHTLKSSAANLGARGLYQNCARLEALARAGSLEGATELTASMAGQLGSALEHLDAIVAEPSG